MRKFLPPNQSRLSYYKDVQIKSNLKKKIILITTNNLVIAKLTCDKLDLAACWLSKLV